MAKKRQISEEEKKQVKEIQKGTDGILRCYISGEIINVESDEIEYDHLIAFSNDGQSDINNIRIFKKKYNREKGKMTLIEYKELFSLKKLYEGKQNKVKLQDIYTFKNISLSSIISKVENGVVTITDGASDSKTFHLLNDDKLNVEYFYGQLPINWIQNDDQQGLQPRVIDFKRLIQLKKHLQEFPQLAPSIARLVNNQIKLFDGQHKLAAQVLNNIRFVDVKVYLTPHNDTSAKNVYEMLLKTNLEAHSKLAQVSFYTNTLFQKWNEMYTIKWEEYVELKPSEVHSESGFCKFLETKESKQDVKKMFEATIIKNVLDESILKKFTAESNKDSNFPLSQDLLQKTIFKNTLYLTPNEIDVDSENDFRDSEKENFLILSELLVEEGFLKEWVPNKKETDVVKLKARRIWTKAALLTWSPFLKTMINATFQLYDPNMQAKNLYRTKMNESQKELLKKFLNRLFNHPFWLQNDTTIDRALGAASSVTNIFEQQGLTSNYILNG